MHCHLRLPPACRCIKPLPVNYTQARMLRAASNAEAGRRAGCESGAPLGRGQPGASIGPAAEGSWPCCPAHGCGGHARPSGLAGARGAVAHAARLHAWRRGSRASAVSLRREHAGQLSRGEPRTSARWLTSGASLALSLCWPACREAGGQGVSQLRSTSVPAVQRCCTTATRLLRGAPGRLQGRRLALGRALAARFGRGGGLLRLREAGVNSVRRSRRPGVGSERRRVSSSPCAGSLGQRRVAASRLSSAAADLLGDLGGLVGAHEAGWCAESVGCLVGYG